MYILSSVMLSFSVFFGSVALQLEVPRTVPIEIDNSSGYVITVLYSLIDKTIKFNTIAPYQVSFAYYGIPYAIAQSTFFRIITSKGHFAVEHGDPIFFVKVVGSKFDYRDVSHASIPLAGLQKIIATVLPDGEITLLAKKIRPADDRPDVSLSIYGKLTGEQSYASPEKILALTLFANANEAYKAKMDDWNPDKLKNAESYEAIKLINWAGQKLGVK